MSQLIIDGNAVYEIDERCMQKKQEEKKKVEKKENQKTEIQKK